MSTNANEAQYIESSQTEILDELDELIRASGALVEALAGQCDDVRRARLQGDLAEIDERLQDLIALGA